MAWRTDQGARSSSKGGSIEIYPSLNNPDGLNNEILSSDLPNIASGRSTTPSKDVKGVYLEATLTQIYYITYIYVSVFVFMCVNGFTCT